MTIMSNDFDFESIRKARARRAASGGVDLATALDQISPDIGKLKVGQTCKLPVGGEASDKNRFRKAVMAITAKVNNITVKGAPWEGRSYRVISDGVDSVFVQRGDDLKASAVRVRKARGPRKAAAPASSTTSTKDGALVTVPA